MDPARPESADLLPLAELAESSRERLRRARAQLASRASGRTDDLARLQQRLVEHIEQLQSQVATELERDRTTLHEERQSALATITAEQQALRDAFAAEQEAARTVLAEELAALRLELEAERTQHSAALEAEVSQWTELRNEVEAGLAARDADLATRTAQLEEQLAAVAAQRSTLQELLATAAAEHTRLEKLAADVQRSPSSSAATEESAAALRLRSEVLQLKTECEALRSTLAERDRELQQVQLQLNTATELTRQLAEQLEAAKQTARDLETERDESAKLVSELRSQLESLRSAPAAVPVAEPRVAEVDSAELDELRARFEMAVEDIRTLKAEKRELESRLASSSPAPKQSSGGSNDWEARKRQLLASLEDELGFNEERAEERATIEGTIRITDEVLAEKQREIDALRAERTAEATQAVAAVNTELIDADEVIAAERQRISTLRAEWEEKLRAAELELSIERAKIAREQSELAQWRMELETLRDAVGGASSSSTAQKQRRWRDKLGLGGHE